MQFTESHFFGQNCIGTNIHDVYLMQYTLPVMIPNETIPSQVSGFHFSFAYPPGISANVIETDSL